MKIRIRGKKTLAASRRYKMKIHRIYEKRRRKEAKIIS